MTPRRRADNAAALRREHKSRIAVADEDAYHQARVLLLIDAFTKRTRGLGDIERLIVLDSVLRFPWILPRLPFKPRRAWPDRLAPDEREVAAFDARYAPARYGPWTDRYELIIRALVGRGLVSDHAASPEDFKTTTSGRRAASQLTRLSEWSLQHDRAAYLYKHANLATRTLDEAVRQALSLTAREGV
ncbi:hypothetical protein [Actinospica robiniae]|uniref:hypothetical protein n=1 Tax=Actinospica robiniae TaxID=304901 RepID=UPI00042325EF|nr:hypothetical protein [Actinospica robiniae]